MNLLPLNARKHKHTQSQHCEPLVNASNYMNLLPLNACNHPHAHDQQCQLMSLLVGRLLGCMQQTYTYTASIVSCWSVLDHKPCLCGMQHCTAHPAQSKINSLHCTTLTTIPGALPV
jgi:hypothetical protein